MGKLALWEVLFQSLRFSPVRVIKPPPTALSQTHSTNHFAFHSSTTYTTAAYGSNPNVFIRLDSVGRPASVGSGSYATIASFHKLPLPLSRRSSSSPSPYATANIGSAVGSATYVTSTNGSGRYSHHIYSKPASTYLPSRVSYYASSQLTHLSQVNSSTIILEKDRRNSMEVNTGVLISPQPDQQGNKLMFLSECREFPSAPCLAGKNNFITTRVSTLLKSRASMTRFRDSFLPARAKDLSTPRYRPILL